MSSTSHSLLLPVRPWTHLLQVSRFEDLLLFPQRLSLRSLGPRPRKPFSQKCLSSEISKTQPAKESELSFLPRKIAARGGGGGMSLTPMTEIVTFPQSLHHSREDSFKNIYATSMFDPCQDKNITGKWKHGLKNLRSISWWLKLLSRQWENEPVPLKETTRETKIQNGHGSKSRTPSEHPNPHLNRF